jgi:hypothetical protein
MAMTVIALTICDPSSLENDAFAISKNEEIMEMLARISTESKESYQVSSLSTSSPVAVDATQETRFKMPFPSGLSALIQAATSQLGQLVDEAPAAPAATAASRPPDPDHYSGVTTDDGASSDGCERLEETNKHTTTPVIVPEPDPMRHTFPELIMTLAIDPRNSDTIAFLPDGKFFAVRAKDFTEGVMKEYFSVTTFEDFLDLINEWGFTKILQEPNDTGIQVFRHPQFVKGDLSKCKDIRFGETPRSARVSALPEGARREYAMSDESTNEAAHTKRRLSPGFMRRRESESSTLLKRRLSLEGSQIPGKADSESGEVASYANLSRTDEIRSVALALTTEKLNLTQELNSSVKNETSATALVDQAVQSVTHTIVTDAIEILLNDEVHTKETYLKHEKELSKSSLPGVIPISKQLFDLKTTDNGNGRRNSIPKEVTTASCGVQKQKKAATASCGIEELSEVAAHLSEELREESERELRKARQSSK